MKSYVKILKLSETNLIHFLKPLSILIPKNYLNDKRKIVSYRLETDFDPIKKNIQQDFLHLNKCLK